MGICVSNSKQSKEAQHELDDNKPKTDEFIPNTIFWNHKDIEDVYEIDANVLGQGSFGEVRVVRHKTTNQKRIVKIIYNQDNAEDKKSLKEIEIMMKLDHPNIAKFYEYFISKKGLFLVMEYLEGGELFSRIKE